MSASENEPTDAGIARIELFVEEREVVDEVLDYRLGPPIEWSDGDERAMLVLDGVDRETLRAIADSCNELETEYANDGLYDMAAAAQRAAAKVIDAEICDGSGDDGAANPGEVADK